MRNLTNTPHTGADKAKTSRNSSKGSWPIVYRWAAMGTLVAYSAVGTKIISAAQAQELAQATHASSPATQGTQPVWRFDIPAGTVGLDLKAFEQATGIVAQFSKEDMKAIASPGVSGIYTAQQALDG